MGANLCSIRHSCFGGPMPTTMLASRDGYAICKQRRIPSRRLEKRDMKREKEASIEKNEYMSLEELLLASPKAPSERGFGNSGEYNVSKHGGFKRKVHPTSVSNCSLFRETLDMVCESTLEDEYSHDIFSICRSDQSKKSKKKVSFRMPEISDVIVIYSPEDDSTADDGNIVS